MKTKAMEKVCGSLIPYIIFYSFLSLLSILVSLSFLLFLTPTHSPFSSHSPHLIFSSPFLSLSLSHSLPLILPSPLTHPILFFLLLSSLSLSLSLSLPLILPSPLSLTPTYRISRFRRRSSRQKSTETQSFYYYRWFKSHIRGILTEF